MVGVCGVECILSVKIFTSLSRMCGMKIKNVSIGCRSVIVFKLKDVTSRLLWYEQNPSLYTIMQVLYGVHIKTIRSRPQQSFKEALV